MINKANQRQSAKRARNKNPLANIIRTERNKKRKIKRHLKKHPKDNCAKKALELL